MKTMKKLIYLILPAITLAACSKEEGNVQSGQDDLAIRMTAGVGVNAQTQTRGEGIIDGDSKIPASGLSIDFARTDGTYSAWSSELNATILGTAEANYAIRDIKFNASQLYKPKPTQTKLIAWYPRATTWTPADATINFGMNDGSTDIMAIEPIQGNIDAKITSVTFHHLLTQVQVKVYAENPTVATNWGGIKSISIKGKKEISQLCINHRQTRM